MKQTKIYSEPKIFEIEVSIEKGFASSVEGEYFQYGLPGSFNDNEKEFFF